MSKEEILNTEFPVKFVSAHALKFSMDEFHQHTTNPELLGIGFEDHVIEVTKTAGGKVEQTERPLNLVANYSIPQWNDYGGSEGYAEFIVRIPIMCRKALCLTTGIPLEIEPWAAAPWAFDVELTSHPVVEDVEDDEDQIYCPPDDEYLYDIGEMLVDHALKNLVAATFEVLYLGGKPERLWMIGDHSWQIPSNT